MNKSVKNLQQPSLPPETIRINGNSFYSEINVENEGHYMIVAIF